jgi:hypothetical protein
MKPIRDLEKALNNQEFYKAQIDESGYVKNILFVSPQITGKHIYKYILPYFCLLSAKIATAITSVEKYSGQDGLKKPKSRLFPQQVIWADYIVFPFILSPLGGAENSFYQELKKVNPNVKIVYHVDFNFYLLDKMHPYYKLFNKKTISIVEDNIYFSDLCLTSNMEFHASILKIVEKLSKTKYVDYPPQLKVGNFPILFDTEILLMNVDYDPEKPVVIDNRKAREVVQKASESNENKEQKTEKIITKKITDGKTKTKPEPTRSTAGKPTSRKLNGESPKAKETGKSKKTRGRPKKS